jgi:adapter protein MecA 1/2
MLSEEDLTDNDITIEDFIQNRGKVQAFLEEIIETAREEVGFETSGPVLSIQIMAAYPDGIMITFSEDPKDMANLIKTGLSQLRDELMDQESWIEAEAVLDEPLTSKEPAKKQAEARLPENLVTIFEFDNMEQVLAFVKRTPSFRGMESSLYKNENTGKYYMSLTKVRMADQRYRAIVGIAMEFAELAGVNPIQQALLMEHSTCLFEKKAINLLRSV